MFGIVSRRSRERNFYAAGMEEVSMRSFASAIVYLPVCTITSINRFQLRVPPTSESAHEFSISFAEHSREPPFALGLQSLLELLLHKFGISRVSHRVHEIDAFGQK